MNEENQSNEGDNPENEGDGPVNPDHGANMGDNSGETGQKEDAPREPEAQSQPRQESTYTAVNDYYESEGYWSKLVANPLNAMSKPDYFKKGWKAILTLSSIIVFCYGVWLLFAELFGDYGYIKSLKNMEVFPMIRSIVASLLSFALSGVVIFVMAGFLWKRANDLRESEDNALMYIVTRLFKLIGEMAAIWPIALAFYTFISVVFVADPYMPLGMLQEGTGELYYRAMKGIFDFNLLEMAGYESGYYIINDFGDYCKHFFTTGLLGIIKGFIIAFINLFVFYLLADVIEVVFNFLTRKNQK